MTADPHPKPSGMARLQRRGSRSTSPSRLKNYALVLAILAVFGLGVYLAGGGRDILRRLYSHFTILLIVFLIIEYIVLKGRDRSRIYKIERDQARAKRREDLDFLREVEEEIEGIRADLDCVDGAQGDGADAERRDRAVGRLDGLYRRISQRL